MIPIKYIYCSILIMDFFDFGFIFLLISVASYTFYHPRPILVDDLNQELVLKTGQSAKIWNNNVCTITPNEKWVKTTFTKSNQPNNGGHTEIILIPTCFYITNGETISILENNAYLKCSDKCQN